MERKATHLTKIIVLILAIVTTTFNVKAQDIIYNKSDSVFIEEIIKKHSAKKNHKTGDRIIALAQEFIESDYIAGTLDEYDNEPLYISCSKLDCTTFVELILAIAISKEDKFTDVCDILEQIRYRNGIRNGYTSRLHYISWWITDPAKQSLIKEVETKLHTARQVLKLNFMSNHPQSYRHLKDNYINTKTIAELESKYNNKETKYIPKENVGKIKKEEIKDGDIIAIVTSIEGLDISHMGFAYWHNDRLHMIHASNKAKKVIDDATSLYEYLAKNKSHLGIKVFRAL